MRTKAAQAGKALAAFAGALLLVAPAGASAAAPSAADGASLSWRIARWSRHIEEASIRFGVPQDWIRRVMRAESGGRPTLNGVPITSRAGAMGLMQLMPGTWAEMRLRHRLGSDPHDPRDNVLAGAAYLRAMYDRFGYPGLFAAYNAGPERYGAYLARKRRLPAETVAYVAAVGGQDGAGLRGPVPGPAAGGRLLVARRTNLPGLTPAPGATAPDSLFIRLSTAGLTTPWPSASSSSHGARRAADD